MMGRIKKLQGTAATLVSCTACGFNAHDGGLRPCFYTSPEHSAPFTFNPALNNIAGNGITDKKLLVPAPDKSLTAWQQAFDTTGNQW